jgi:hypothetical protein
LLTFASNEAELVDEGLARLAAVITDEVSSDKGGGVFVGEGLEGEGEGEAEVLLELLAVGPVAAR